MEDMRQDGRRKAMSSIARLQTSYESSDRKAMWRWTAFTVAEIIFAAVVCALNLSMAPDFGWSPGLAIAIALDAGFFGHSVSAVVFHRLATPQEEHRPRMWTWAIIGTACAVVSMALSTYRTGSPTEGNLSIVLCAVELTIAAVLGIIAGFASIERLQPGFLHMRVAEFLDNLSDTLGARQTYAQELLEAWTELTEEKTKLAWQQHTLKTRWLKKYISDIRRACPFPIVINPDDERGGHQAVLDSEPISGGPQAMTDFLRMEAAD